MVRKSLGKYPIRTYCIAEHAEESPLEQFCFLFTSRVCRLTRQFLKASGERTRPRVLLAAPRRNLAPAAFDPNSEVHFTEGNEDNEAGRSWIGTARNLSFHRGNERKALALRSLG